MYEERLRLQHTRLNSRTSWATERTAAEDDEDLDETLAMVRAEAPSIALHFTRLVLMSEFSSGNPSPITHTNPASAPTSPNNCIIGIFAGVLRLADAGDVNV